MPRSHSFRYHLDRLFENMQLLSMDMPPYFTAEFLYNLITQLLNKNRMFEVPL
jgi:hypothetical protein